MKADSQEKLPIISAIVPAYNRADLLPRALDSILNQRCPPAEIIVVDDGSEDDTAAVVISYGDRIYYHYQENGGVSAARNTGVKIASSPWVAFLDSDDYWDEGFLARVVPVMMETGFAADVYFSDMVFPERSDPAFRSLWDRVNFVVDKPYHLVEDGREWALLPLQPFRIQSAVFRRSRYLASGGMHESLRVREDQYFFLKIGLGSPMCAVKGTAVYVGENAPNRLTRSFRGRVWPETFVTMYGDLLKQNGLSAENRAVLRERYGEALYELALFDLRAGNAGSFLSKMAKSVRSYPSGLIGHLSKRI